MATEAGPTTVAVDSPRWGASRATLALVAGLWSRASAMLSMAPFQAGSVSAAAHAFALVAVATFVLPGDQLTYQEPAVQLELVIEEPAALPPEPLVLTLAPSAAAGGNAHTSFALGVVGDGGAGLTDPNGEPRLAIELTGNGGRGQGGDDGTLLTGHGLLKEVQEVKKQAAFFGISAQGRKFAFVVDTSGSMAVDDRWKRARIELERSLRELGYGQEYFVVFFNHTTFPMPQGRLFPARPSNVASTIQWIQRAVPAGSTEPWPGLSMAIRLKPDAVFLLTDGLFDPAVIKNVQSLSTRDRVPIHTIGFAINNVPLNTQQQIEEQLTTISRATGGTYRFVP